MGNSMAGSITWASATRAPSTFAIRIAWSSASSLPLEKSVATRIICGISVSMSMSACFAIKGPANGGGASAGAAPRTRKFRDRDPLPRKSCGDLSIARPRPGHERRLAPGAEVACTSRMTSASSGPVRQFPAVRQYMTLAPHTVGCDRSIAEAHELLRAHHIRHLPVLDGARVVGDVSERDLTLVSSLPGVDAGKVSVEEAMVEDVFLVDPDAPIAEVVETMIQKKVGSALVGAGDRIVGEITTIDTQLAQHELLEQP